MEPLALGLVDFFQEKDGKRTGPEITDLFRELIVENWLIQLFKCGFCGALVLHFEFPIVEIWARIPLYLYYKEFFFCRHVIFFVFLDVLMGYLVGVIFLHCY